MNVDSKTLYHACQMQQPHAYESLFDYLFRVCFQIVHDQPNAADLAQDCAQRALIRVHNRLDSCREPAAFIGWSRRIAANLALDELRRRKRLFFNVEETLAVAPAPAKENPATAVTRALDELNLYDLLQVAPISERSRRVVIGRYLERQDDYALAAIETELSTDDKEVLPSHIQVTRSKNMAKLRQWDALRELWEETFH